MRLLWASRSLPEDACKDGMTSPFYPGPLPAARNLSPVLFLNLIRFCWHICADTNLLLCAIVSPPGDTDVASILSVFVCMYTV